ncbi:MAG TPA: LemA family protein [Taishania sp.]|nr:LemA family protein [Taishania sp.]HNS42787.1 LemA family protein [Taishania sp.]
MKRSTIIILVVIGILMFWVIGVQRKAVTLSESIENSWGNVETAYQRRNDLIGNLVKTVQGSADFERKTLEAVVNARAKATQTKIDPSNMTEEDFKRFEEAQANVKSSLDRLLVVVENYPDLKSSSNFLKLQDELASTENQILTARTRFNDEVKPYNTYIKKFPTNLIAGMFGFTERQYFKSVEGADKAPDVEFNF